MDGQFEVQTTFARKLTRINPTILIDASLVNLVYVAEDRSRVVNHRVHSQYGVSVVNVSEEGKLTGLGFIPGFETEAEAIMCLNDIEQTLLDAATAVGDELLEVLATKEGGAA